MKYSRRVLAGGANRAGRDDSHSPQRGSLTLFAGGRSAKELRAAVRAELRPVGRVQEFLAARIADALGEYPEAESGKLTFDPARRTQDELLETVLGALRELHQLQTRRAKRKRKPRSKRK